MCSSLLVLDGVTADLVCTGCGVVHASRLMDRGPEWRSTNDDEGSKGGDGGRADISMTDANGPSRHQTHLVGTGSETLNKAFLASEFGRGTVRSSLVVDKVHIVCERLKTTSTTKVC